MATNHINGPSEPFGYRRKEDGTKEPIPEQLAALDKALDYLKAGCSLKSVRDWLEKRTGRYISIIGLRKIWLIRQAQQGEDS